MSSEFLFLAANIVALLNVALYVYRSALVRKKDYLVMSAANMGLETTMYVLGGCWSSVVYYAFVAFCDLYNARAKAVKTWIVLALCAIGVALVIWVNGATSFRFRVEDYIPLLSIIFYIFFSFRTVSATQLNIVEALDTMLWVVYDYTHFMIINVVNDFFLILLPLFEYYAIKVRAARE